MCGKGLPECTYVFYEADETGTVYGNRSTYYASVTKPDGETNYFTFPECTNVPDGMRFVGWRYDGNVKPQEPEGLKVTGVEELNGLKQPGDVVEVPGTATDYKYYARYMELYFSGGTGTEADPFVISTTDDFNELANAVTNGYGFKGLYLILNADLDYTDKTFTPVGNSDREFNGTFDGKGHSISGVGIDSPDDYQGVFGNVENKGTVKNLTLDNSNISAHGYVGGIVGLNQGTIENCHVTSSVTIQDNGDSESENFGGIAGSSLGTIYGCTSAANVEGDEYVGGIVGELGDADKMEDCLYLGNSVIGDNYVGALCGNNAGSISNSYYVPWTDGPKGVGSNTSSNDEDGATAGYSVSSGTEGLKLDYGAATSTYSYNGIEVYSFEQGSHETASGLLYGDKLYAASETAVVFNVSASNSKNVDNVAASAGTLYANKDGSYALEMTTSDAVITADVATIALGDANGDGTVNMSDVVTIMSYILGDDPSPFYEDAADMNDDGEVTVTDASILLDELDQSSQEQ